MTKKIIVFENFDEFVNRMQEGIKKYLPEQYTDATVTVRTVQKLTNGYTGLSVCLPGQKIAAVVNLNDLYQRFSEGKMPLAEVFSIAAEQVQKSPEKYEIAEQMTDYNFVKDRLFVRVSSLEKNLDMLQQVPYKVYSDLALTCHVLIDEDPDVGTASVMLTRNLLSCFGMDEDQLFSDALRNSAEILPGRVEGIKEVMIKTVKAEMASSGMSDEEAVSRLKMMGLDPDEPDPTPLTVISNDRYTNGASALFYHGMMDQIGERLGGDYYILPSSIHEVLVLPDTDDMSPDELRAMVGDVNMNEVSPAEVLSDEVYHYDTKNHLFEKAAEFKARQK